MDRPEDAAQEFRVFRILLQAHEIVVQPVQIFGTLLQEFIY
jgi:hypothetical protein